MPLGTAYVIVYNHWKQVVKGKHALLFLILPYNFKSYAEQRSFLKFIAQSRCMLTTLNIARIKVVVATWYFILIVC